MRKSLSGICILLVFLGMSLNRVLTTEYGNKGGIIISGIAVIAILLAEISLLLSKKYFAAVIMLTIVIPAIVMFIGIYLDDLLTMAIGFGSIFIIMPKVTKKMKN